MNTLKVLMAIVSGCALFGCDSQAVKDPPVTITFRTGVLSEYVMQVSNLSAAEGMEVYVYVANENSSIRSGNVVIPANSAKEFGALEIKWNFQSGDRGFVRPVKYGKKLFFELTQNNQYRTWFGYDDIPEVDVAAQVRARQIAEHEAWLKEATESMCMSGRNLFVAITLANTEREAAGLGPVWPKPKGSFKDRAKDTLKGWKEKVAAKFGNRSENSVSQDDADIADMKFGSSGEYFERLFGVRSPGTDKHLSYVSVDLRVVSSSDSKDGSIPADAVKWSVLADAEAEMSDCLPILVSANFPCEKLRSFWDGKENASEIIPLSDSGDTKNESFVVVYKGGRVKALTSATATLANIYGGPFNTYTNGYNRQVQYITPKGVVNAVGVTKQ